ncbi:MAG: hypothetical protein Q9165_008512 [Trypethelium subeluteriae]
MERNEHSPVDEGLPDDLVADLSWADLSLSNIDQTPFDQLIFDGEFDDAETALIGQTVDPGMLSDQGSQRLTTTPHLPGIDQTSGGGGTEPQVLGVPESEAGITPPAQGQTDWTIPEVTPETMLEMIRQVQIDSQKTYSEKITKKLEEWSLWASKTMSDIMIIKARLGVAEVQVPFAQALSEQTDRPAKKRKQI